MIVTLTTGLVFFIREIRNNSTFKVENILVDEKAEAASGKRPIPKEQLQAEIKSLIENQMKQNIFKLDANAIYETLKSNEWIDEVVVRKEIPSAIRVFYRPRKIEAVLNTGDGLYYVDIKGAPFKKLLAGYNADFPIITGCSRLDDECVVNSLSVISTLRGISDVDVAEVKIREDKAVIAVLVKPIRAVINIGNYNKDSMDLIEKRSERIPKIIAEAASRRLSIRRLDLNFSDRAIAELD